ncbi:MAG: tyrosine-type recombinase/integrase [Prevotella sp.]|jgi:site-specific recombinase XerD
MRRAFKTVFYIRGNYVNKGGQSSIMIRLCLDRERLCIGTTGIAIDPKMWDKDHQKLKGRTTVVYQVNKKLESIRSEIQGIVDKLELEDSLTLEKVKSVYQRTDDEYNTIGKLFDKYLNIVKEKTGVTLGITSYRKYNLCYKYFMGMLQKTHHRKDMLLRELNPTIIEDFFIYLTTVVGHCNNTAVRTMKMLRTVIMHGIKLGVLHTDPFLGVQFRMEKVNRGFLTEEEIDALMQKHFDIPRLELVRDLFVFSCFTGLAYIDVKSLKPQNIVTLNGVEWIIIARVKTDTPVNVVLFDGAKRIMEKYKDVPGKKGHVFPIFSNQKVNQYLKEIAASCGIKKELTFHMARHTFATLTLSKGVPVETVSRMLGHTSIRTTQIYARITNKKIEQDMAQFFKDNTIQLFDKESVNMTQSKTEENKKPEAPAKRRGRPRKNS